MIHFIVATHGPLAQALIDSASMVFGSLSHTSALALSEDIEQFKHDFDSEMSARQQEAPDGIVVLCDLECGTPYNIACRYAFDDSLKVPVAVLTGINFPTLLMSADFVEESDPYQVATTLQQEAAGTIVVAQKPDTQEQDDDF